MMQKVVHICFNRVLLMTACLTFSVVMFGEVDKDVTNCQSKVSYPSITFHSHCVGPKGLNRLGTSLFGYYLNYEFNSTNHFDKSESMDDGVVGISDVVRKKLSPPHMRYLDRIELWHKRPNRRLYRIDLKGNFPLDATCMDIAKFYKEICDELDFKFDVKMTCHVPSREALLYDAESVIDGFRFRVSISKSECHVSIISTKVLEGRGNNISVSERDNDVHVKIEDL